MTRRGKPRKRVTLICEQCGVKFEVKLSCKDQRFCSRKCWGKWKSENLSGKNSLLWKEKEKNTCEWCGIEFRVHMCRLDKRFHNRECRLKWQQRRTVKKICAQCGIEFELIASKSNRRFHNQECASIWASENLRGEKAARWNGGLVTKECEQCGVKFEVKPSAADGARFCGKECMGKWKSENLRGEKAPSWKEKTKKICKQCGVGFEVIPSHSNQQFHNIKCKGRWMSERIRGKNHSGWKPKAKKICEQCSVEFEVRPSGAGQRFHNRECKDRYFRGENSANWLGGKSFEPYGIEFNELLKETIRNRDGFVCQECGESENTKRLPVHHVDYDKKNNASWNLILLCVSCHGKTNTRRSYWQRKLENLMRRHGIGIYDAGAVGEDFSQLRMF